ncbi:MULTISPECIES: nuclear transport factor 2 family protein [Haloferax]|uniref:Nuclear transport factor 2 family protein n=2 Tax=Haloferax TaxID=2251 RepID=A0A6G1YZW8_9EURY|nr:MULTISPECIES: nuclear transport factor 2 family protein [Haloferax]KAB1187237.1 nuclear transport factor 2 family protein [Haloferax sp. CBA1149]MRW79879.1 nuclear transport factor 2 family protein [Haloferax marinisediminis]
MKTTQEVLDRHLALFGEGDMDGILADYDDSSIIITPERTYRGLDEIPWFFEGLFADFGQEGAVANIDLQKVEGDIAYITWSGETPDKVYEFCTDTFVVQDGVITTQTYGGKIESK